MVITLRLPKFKFPGHTKKIFVQSTKSGTTSREVKPCAPVVGPLSTMANTGERVMPSSSTTVLGVGHTRLWRIIEMAFGNHGDFTEYSTPLTYGTAQWQKQSIIIVETEPEQGRRSSTVIEASTSGLGLVR